MTSRILPVEEWSKLKNTPLGENWTKLAPEWTRVIVVEDAGTIIAHWLAFNAVHVEGLWIDDDHRKLAGVPHRLLATMQRTLGALDCHTVLTQAESPEVAALLEHIGGSRVPGETYVFPIGE